MKKARVLFGHIFIILLCILPAQAVEHGTRKEYAIPFRVDNEYIPIQAAFSCRSWEQDKAIDMITSSDPDFILFTKRIVSSMIEGNLKDIQELAGDDVDSDKLSSDLVYALASYKKYKLSDIRIKMAVFVEDVIYLYCVAFQEEKSKTFSYQIRRATDGHYRWDIYGSPLCGGLLYNVVKQRVSGESIFGTIEDKEFDGEMIITPNPNHNNFVSVKYNEISFMEGVPLYNNTGNDLLNFLTKYWDRKMHAGLDEIIRFHDEKSGQKIRDEFSRSGKDYFVQQQELKRDGSYPYQSLSYAIIADPITILYYGFPSTHRKGKVLYNDGSGYRFIRHHDFGNVRTLFDNINKVKCIQDKKNNSSR